MKRFLQKSYSWLATLLFAVAFAVSGSASAQDVVFKLDASADPNSDLQVKTDKGVTITYHQYGGVGNLYSYGWPFEFSSANGNIEKIVLVTSETLNDVYVATGTWAAGSKTWTGSASSVTIETSGDHYVTEAQVWLEEGAAGGETGGEVIGIEMPLYGAANGTKDGVIFNFVSRSWDGGSANLYGNGGRNASYGIATFDCFDKNIVKVEFTCALNGWGAAPTPADAAMTVVETENLGGSFTTNGAVAIWEGSAHNLTFSSTDDLDVTKVVVYVEAGGEVVKECTVGVDHYADNCKPGKHETPFSRYITLYMQENAATTTWTGSDNCPAEVTLTNEAGQKLPISQFNYWQNSDQIGVVLEENITTPGVYTLHIPEGLVPFASGKFNKEINATWTVVAPDTRPTKDIVFDFTDGNYTNDGTLSYTKDGVVFTLNENRYNATAQGFRIATDGWVSFAAPEKATIKSIQLLQESSYGVSPDFSANVGEVSVYDKTLYWSGDDASVTLTDNYGTCYFTKAIVTLAVEESVEPTTTFKGVVTPNLTSVSSLDELEGIQLTLVDADKVSVLEESYGIYVQNEDGGEVYAVWHPYYGGTYEIDGNVITLRNFYSDSSNSYFAALPAGEFDLYFEDYGTFDVSNAAADWDGYFQTFTVAYKGAPAPVPFELVFRNNMVVCENGQKVEANEAGVGADFYLVNEGLTAVGKTATLYKDGNAMSFVMTLIDGTSVSFLGGSSLITEPGTYLLEVPAGTYVDAAGNPSVAYYGQWVVIQKDEPVVDPVKKDKYTIKLSGTDYYFTTTEVKDNNVTTYSISATPEYFYIEPSNGGYTIKSADTDKWVGYDVISTWDFSNDEKVWTINSLEGEPTLIRKNSSKGFGVDNRFEGAGVYTDKSGQYWVIEKFVEPEPEPTVWNGNVKYSEAASVEDLLSFTVEFEEAASVEASGYDVLGVVFNGVEPYAVVLANGVFDAFGSMKVEGSKATFGFQKIAELDVNAQAAAKANIAKIGSFQPQTGKASVVFAGKSFVVDGQLITDILCNEYEFNGGTVTGIETIATEGAAQIFDLQGRRVRAAQKGIFLVNGKKVVK